MKVHGDEYNTCFAGMCGAYPVYMTPEEEMAFKDADSDLLFAMRECVDDFVQDFQRLLDDVRSDQRYYMKRHKNVRGNALKIRGTLRVEFGDGQVVG